MKGITKWFGLCGLFMAAGVYAQNLEGITEAKDYTTPFGESLKYRLYKSPDIKEGEPCPLIILLHGAGERGNNNISQMTHGVKDIIAYGQAKHQPFILIAPQCPVNMQWVNTPWGDPSHVMPEFPSLPMKLALELCEQAASTLPVDTKRIYIMGLSMGGYGTWDAIQRKPSFFAAAMPVCGGGDTHCAAALKDMPIWIFHGDSDGVVKTQRSRDMVAALKSAGGDPKYTELKGTGHNAWTAAYSNTEALDWLFSQKRN